MVNVEISCIRMATLLPDIPTLCVPALWDTGAQLSCISDRVADAMGLVRDDCFNASGFIGESLPVECGVVNYKVEGIGVKDRLMPIVKGLKHEMIIGLDFISAGISTISKDRGDVVLSFKKSGEMVDYTIRDISIDDILRVDFD